MSDPERRWAENRFRSMLGWMTAGQLDAGFASLATFAVGIYAVRSLSPTGLGVYALAFAAFHVVTQLPTQLIFGPAEVTSVDHPDRTRLGTLSWSTRLGFGLSAVAGLGLWLNAQLLVGDVDRELVVAITWGAFLLALVSPLQDHIRRLFHLANSSWRAAGMSAIQLVATVAALFPLGNVSPAFATFGALAFGNVVALAVGSIWVLRAKVPALDKPPKRQLRSLGGWLLLTGLAATGFGYAAISVLRVMAGTEAVGFVEGARVVAQPLNVIGLGLIAVVGPRAMEAGAKRNRAMAILWRRRYLAVYCSLALVYGLMVSTATAINPLPALLPNAFATEGLVLAMIVATTLNSISGPWRAELLGARLQASVGRIAVSSGALEVAVVAATAPGITVFAAPLGIAAGAVFRWVGFALRLEKWGRETPKPGSTPDPASSTGLGP